MKQKLIITRILILGLNGGLCYSLFFKTTAEIAFPVLEYVSDTILTFANNFKYFVHIFVYGFVCVEWTTFIACFNSA